MSRHYPSGRADYVIVAGETDEMARDRHLHMAECTERRHLARAYALELVLRDGKRGPYRAVASV